MKRFIPLLFTCLIVLTSMSDCEKWYENNDESIYVDVNGKTLGYTMPHSIYWEADMCLHRSVIGMKTPLHFG